MSDSPPLFLRAARALCPGRDGGGWEESSFSGGGPGVDTPPPTPQRLSLWQRQAGSQPVFCGKTPSCLFQAIQPPLSVPVLISVVRGPLVSLFLLSGWSPWG